VSLEKQIGIAHKLYQCRRTAWQIFGDDTPDVLAEWISVIKKEMAATGKDELLSCLALAEQAVGKEKEGIRIMLIMAAAVEMIEPSVNQQP